MSFLKQLLNPFIEFDADKKQTAPNTPAAPAQPPASTSAPQPRPPVAQPPKAASPPQKSPSPPAKTAPATTPAAPVVPPPSNDPVHHPMIDAPGVKAATQVPTFSPSGTLIEPLPQHVQYFEKLIDEANQNNPLFKGPDYKEFIDSKVDIDDITDEALKYTTAYNVLKASGLTVEKLLATGQEYINLIGRDLNSFKGAHSVKYRKEVGQKEQLIQQKAAQLQALAQQMNALKGEINQLTQDISLVKDQLNTVKNSFLLAGENKQKEIETELQKIARHF